MLESPRFAEEIDMFLPSKSRAHLDVRTENKVPSGLGLASG
jgi:hypothetical protein